MALLLTGPSQASADSSVVVLGVRSLDGDDALAHRVSVALRAAAQTMPGWNVSPRDVSLAQMSLAHGCDEPDARCMADIAGTLEVDRLIYGMALRVGDEVQLSLFNFDAVTGQVESSLEQKVQAAELAEPALDSTVATLVRRLAGEKVAGMLRVSGDVPGARVWLDGRDAGTLDVRGELLITEVPAGTHALVVEGDGVRRQVSVEVVEATTTSARVSLRPTASSSSSQSRATFDDEEREEQTSQGAWRRPVGWTAVALGAGLVGATIYTWVRIGAINDDPDLRAYRNEFPAPGQPNGTSDVCREADSNTLAMRDPSKAGLERKARDLCGQADTFEMLQYVFLGTAIAAAGVGTYLLLTAPDKPRRVSLQPRFGTGRASLTASYRF